MEFWLNWLAAILSLNENGVSSCSLPENWRKTAASGPRGGDPDPAQQFCCKRRRVAGLFFIVTAEMSAHPYVTSGSRLYVHYSGAEKKLLREEFVMKKVESPPTSDFMDRGYVQHAESEWRRDHCIRHHSYLVLKKHNRRDAIAFAYTDSMALGSKMVGYLKKQVWTGRRVTHMETW